MGAKAKVNKEEAAKKKEAETVVTEQPKSKFGIEAEKEKEAKMRKKVKFRSIYLKFAVYT